MKPFLKHAGAKYSELKHFQKYFPSNIRTLYEPFVGGGSIFLNTDAQSYVINDYDIKVSLFWKDMLFNNLERRVAIEHSSSLCDGNPRHKDNEIIYGYLTTNHGRYSSYELIEEFENITSPLKIKLLKKLIKKVDGCRELDGNYGWNYHEKTVMQLIKTFRMEEWYYEMRDKYNSSDDSVATFFVKEYCFQGMDRVNNSNKFNVPYGGHSYTNKSITSKLDTMREFVDKFKNKHFHVCNLDFNKFFDMMQTSEFHNNDFIFLDPPYTTTFSTYAGNTFNQASHVLLRDRLVELKDKVKFMLVINKDEFTSDLYKNFHIIDTYEKKYKMNFKNRCDSSSTHMIVTNYKGEVHD